MISSMSVIIVMLSVINYGNACGVYHNELSNNHIGYTICILVHYLHIGAPPSTCMSFCV